ncbi:MAG: hypothetical protein FJ102_21735, partial [Deltaproteobacteria bacterium]|nr:hypothetical protein [Deltaproteobacteria bacterium]
PPVATLADAPRLTGEAPGDQLGSAAALMSDATGDGLPDFALGAVGLDGNRGGTYLVPGSPAD